MLRGAVALALLAAVGSMPGSWQRLPAAPASAAIPYQRAFVWTGKELIVVGRAERNVAFSYDPASRRWRTLHPPAGPPGAYEGSWHAVWTGRLMLVWGPNTLLSFDPAANRWRSLPASPLTGGPAGLVAWTGRELIGWGGGCCGDATKEGVAYDPAAGRWRRLPTAPTGAQQSPVGVWTGRELVVLASRDMDGKPTAGVAYDPAKNAWRRIAAPPQERLNARAVWDGHDVLVVGGSRPQADGKAHLASVPYAYDPRADRWRTLAPMDGGAYGRVNAAVVWTGSRLLLWGGQTQYAGRDAIAPHGLAYDPRADSWTLLPGAPLLGRINPAGVWTGKAFLVWGGDALVDQLPGAGGADSYPFVDGAAFTPRG